jgi:hypothetical protein
MVRAVSLSSRRTSSCDTGLKRATSAGSDREIVTPAMVVIVAATSGGVVNRITPLTCLVTCQSAHFSRGDV